MPCCLMQYMRIILPFFFFLMKFGVAHDVQALAFYVSFPIGMSSSMSVGLL